MNIKRKRILFILKKRELNPHAQPGDWNSCYTTHLSTGLWNSVRFIEIMFKKFIRGYDVSMVQVQDNNDIDREVTKFKPDIVVIEALWVVPEKFEVLAKLHKKVTWIIRLHSETPFLVSEGIAFEWLKKYDKHPRVKISSNSKRLIKEIKEALEIELIYLPNFYAGGEKDV